ncbi:MAG TPA: M28 family peptidase [Burkholderiales bacterium]
MAPEILPQGKRGWRRFALRWLVILVLLVVGGSFLIRMPGRSHSGPLPLPAPEHRETEERLRRHVQALAGDIGERNMWRPQALAAAAAYIEGEFGALGYRVMSQAYQVSSPPGEVRNLEVEIPGGRRPEEIVILGAHYDSVFGSPGANDNATGVAALIELARLLRDARPDRTLRLVAFANEEPPFFTTGEMGSQIHARRARERGERVQAMLSLETLGYYSDDPKSQRYPFPLGLVYPSTGNFVGFVGNLGSAQLVRRCVELFRSAAAFPSEGGALPGWIPGVGWSDHRSYWEEGYPAVMVTDTALYRYPWYHGAGDTPGRVHYERLARVTRGLVAVAAGLAVAD